MTTKKGQGEWGDEQRWGFEKSTDGDRWRETHSPCEHWMCAKCCVKHAGAVWRKEEAVWRKEGAVWLIVHRVDGHHNRRDWPRGSN